VSSTQHLKSVASETATLTISLIILPGVPYSAVRFWIFITRFGFGLKLRFRFQNHYSTTFNKK